MGFREGDEVGGRTGSSFDLFIRRVANYIVGYPWTNVVISLVLMLAVMSALPKLYKDTRADAFLAPDNPALLYKNKVKEVFGLSDPIVIAVVNDADEFGVFNPQSLALVEWLSAQVSNLDNINSDRVTSLATENNITGSEEGMDVTEFFDAGIDTQSRADQIWASVSDFPLYMGSIVAKDRKATLIVAELIDESLVESTYQEIIALIKNAPKLEGEIIHVAGEGAIAGFLGSYIDADAQKLNPLAGLIITCLILFAFWRFTPGLLSNIIIAASVLMTLGIMALSGVPFFVITNALPVILIGISVADSIHIYSHYFESQARQPQADKKVLLAEAIVAMWRPITLTTLTTMAGFLGLYFSATMPPFKYFGLYTAIGVAIAWYYSLVFLPAAMAIIKPTASNKMIQLAKNDRVDRFSGFMVFVGGLTLKRPRVVILVFLVTVVAGLYAASKLKVNEDRISTFHSSESLYKADKAINKHFDGTYNLDIVIEGREAEAVFDPGYLSKMEALQHFSLSLKNVQGATSIVDYLKQMNRSLNGGGHEQYSLPLDKGLIAQYFLLYSASGDPTDFEAEVDYDYRIANIRLALNKGSYQDTKNVVIALEEYIYSTFNTESITATLSGRVTVNYHWIKDLGKSHLIGLAISLFLVWAVSALLFRSLSAGLFAVTPVACSILIVYSTMVLLKIDLGIGTSMFASVAIGLGVDFAIHTIDRLRSLYNEEQGSLADALARLYPSTGRALLFNYLAIACGFSVLISSKVVPLTDFGVIVVVSVTTSFLASISLLPALISVFKPSFITSERSSGRSTANITKIASTAVVLVFLAGVFQSPAIHANSVGAKGDGATITTKQLVENINSVDDGKVQTRRLIMTLTDKRGKSRVRETVGYRKYFSEEKRTALFYKYPSNVKGTSFLIFDYERLDVDDDQWLYLPALRKVRRISTSNRGDYFLGTDFTYEDIKLEGRVSTEDYNFTIVKREAGQLLLQAIPKSDAVAKELGYSKVEFWVSTAHWMITKADYWDVKGKILKTLVASEIYEVDGIMTRHQLKVANHKTGHNTLFIFSDVDYNTPIKDGLFTKRAMKKGL